MRSLSLLGLCLFGFSCSSSTSADGGTGGGGTGGSGGSGESGDTACTNVANARCVQRIRCEPALFTQDYPSLDACTAREKLTCLNSLTAPGTAQTPDGVQACADAFPDLNCTDWYNSKLPSACLAKSGTHAIGAACSFSAQCSSAFCALGTGASCGVCAADPVVGTPCIGGIGCNGHSLYCDAVSGTCQNLVTTAGTFCDAGSCGYLLGCVLPTDGGAGSCQTLGVADAGCDSAQHTGPACAAALGFTCERKFCTVTLFADAGLGCGTDRDAGTFTRCANSSTCTGDTGAQTCVAPANDGAACDTANGVQCLTPARCVSTNGMATDGGPVTGTCSVNGATACQ